MEDFFSDNNDFYVSNNHGALTFCDHYHIVLYNNANIESLIEWLNKVKEMNQLETNYKETIQ